MIFNCHSEKQERILFSDKRLVIASTGIQFGKTLSAMVWLKMMMHKYISPTDTFLITSPTYPIFKQSTLPPFLRIMKNLGIYDRKDECFRITNGGTCYFRTGKNPDSVVGITQCRAAVADEAGLYSRYFWENIQGRSSFCRAPIRIVTSPYSQNWLYKDYIRVKQKNPDALPDVDLIQATSRENPYFPQEEYEEKKRTMDPRRFNMIYGGKYEKMEGLVYDCFDEALNVCEPFDLPSETRFFAGIDWGYTHPFVLVVHALLPSGLRFQVHEFVKSGLTIKDISEFCLKIRQIFPIERAYAGPDQPGSIEYLNRVGFPTVAANNDIRLGIDYVYEGIKSRTFKFFRGTSPHTLDEMETYHYPDPKEIKADTNLKDMVPVKQDDDALDAIRYVILSTIRANIKKTPKIAGRKRAKTEEERIKELLKLPHTEK